MGIGSRWPLALAALVACKESHAPEKRAPTAAPIRTAEASPAQTPPAQTPDAQSAAPAQPASDPAADAKREALEAIARPFLPASTDNLIMEQGPFGPSSRTIVIVTFTGEGRGDFSSFALVPDGSAGTGYRKLPMPWLPSGSTSGEMEFAAIGNLDKDPALEIVVETQVTRAIESKEGGYTEEVYEYIALDWDARHKKFVRLTAVEKKLQDAFAESAEAPTSDEVRKVLGLEP